MTALLMTVHIVSCVVLILVVLLQAGKGADMGAALGGGGASPMFGSSTASNPLTRITTAMAVLFMTTSLMLAVISAKQASIFDSTPEPLATPPAAESNALPQDGSAAPGVIPPTGAAPAEQPLAGAENKQPVAEATDNAAKAVPAVPSDAPAAAPAAPAPAAAAQPAPTPAAPPSGNAAPVDQAPGAP